MPAYNFKARFAPFILSGEKQTTIRLPRKRATRPGDVLSLYTGMRTPTCDLIARTTCISVTPVRLCYHEERAVLGGRQFSTAEETVQLAQRDGFASAVEMFRWFFETYGPGPFVGEVIEWAYPFRLPESEGQS